MDHILSIKLKDLGIALKCGICKGFPVNAVRICECLHCYCKSCIVLHLTNEWNGGMSRVDCPVCGVLVHKSRPFLALRPDNAVQTLLYKMNTGMFFDEMQRRRKFFAENPLEVSDIALNLTEEDVGQVVPTWWMPKEVPSMITIGLYYDADLTWSLLEQMSPDLCRRQEKALAKGASFHLLATTTIGEIRKMISLKCRIGHHQMVVILDVNVVLENGQSLADVLRFRDKAMDDGILNLTFIFLQPDISYLTHDSDITAFVNGLILRKPQQYIKSIQKRASRKKARYSEILPAKEDKQQHTFTPEPVSSVVKLQGQKKEVTDYLFRWEGTFSQEPKQMVFRVATPPTGE